MVLSQDELSDRCKIVTELEEILVSDEDNYNWIPLTEKCQWENKLAKQFTEQLSEEKIYNMD